MDFGQVELRSLDTNGYNPHDPDNSSFKSDHFIKQCPLCNSEVKLFFINLNEKVLMCKNTSCEYPFGHENLQFFKENSEINTNDEVMSIRTAMSPDTNGTYSVTGNTASWFEIERLQKANDSEAGDFFKPPQINERIIIPAKPKLIDEKIQNNIKAISKLTSQLKPETPVVIKNKKWIEKLQQMQSSTSKQIVKPLEILECHKDDTLFGGGELKIDISNSKEMPSITIGLNNTK